MDWASPMSARKAVKMGKMSGGGGDGQVGLGHHGEQGGGLECDGLAACVGTGDYELALRGG